MLLTEFPKQTLLRQAITDTYRKDEITCVEYLLSQINIDQRTKARISQTAEYLVKQVREQRIGKGGIEAFLYQYDLSSEEGIALMCLAEALLRIPDVDTADQLIRDKLTSADWKKSAGKSDSMFVNAATWGLMLTGKVLSVEQNQLRWKNTLKKLLERTGEPVIRKAVGEAMKILGKQFILGRDINEALKRSKKRGELGYRFSFDMLGEAARTKEDAERYFHAYQKAIDAIGEHANNAGPINSSGISIKLSALYPRYEFGQQALAVPALVEQLTTLALQAKKYDIPLTVDAEEANRLDISLDIITKVFCNPALDGWEGFGLAVQAYQKRAPYVLDYLIDLAKQQKKRLQIRLVKGAYWDSEIKDSQVNSYEDYPVYTRKMTTDVSYLVCAQKLIQAIEFIYPQFATHNAHTVATILSLISNDSAYEFQCLQGMGRALYDHVVSKKGINVPTRVYAPVGSHQDLLPYLVRRLLENGANTSFVNRIVDEKAPISELIEDPAERVKQHVDKRHPKIPLPKNIYGEQRLNSRGIDVTNWATLNDLSKQLNQFLEHEWFANTSTVRVQENVSNKPARDVLSPRNRQEKIGTVIEGDKEDAVHVLEIAEENYEAWNRKPIQERAACLRKAADLFEENRAELMMLAIREAGKTIPDAIAEVREAIDFCRYYALQAEQHLVNKTLVGPTGETNELQMHGRGVVLCISPWNFPLAIFTGQMAAALVTGNCVIAKPAAQTPLIAAKAVALMYQAGVPNGVLQLFAGPGRVIGDVLVSDSRISAVLFTGSTETAQHINRTLAERSGPLVPFVAETGGQNAMIVDSSALPEQVVMDVIQSAFYSAGQRCSALRVLFLQDDVADKMIHMLCGAMAELKVGDPAFLSTDVGPVIDESACKTLSDHYEKMKEQHKLLYQVSIPESCQQGVYFAPCAFEISDISVLEREVFGPILHVVRYRRDALDDVIKSINKTGYGLTLGIHTRLDDRVDYIQQRVRAGNAYVNRNMIGAVVGVQPFGGEGLSGTGPKAGGPHYLSRLCVERTLSINTAATGGNATLLSLGE